jgi:hypothetical protein
MYADATPNAQTEAVPLLAAVDAPSARAVYEDQTRRCEEVQDPAFLDRIVRPHLADTGGPGVWDTEVIQLDGSGAATVRVSLDGQRPVYAKVFPFDDGPVVHQKLVDFRAAGFDANSRYQTVEPLGWYPEYDLLLCRGVPGRCLNDMYGEPGWEAAIAEAGTWLGRFHASGLKVGRPKSLIVTSELVSLAKRAAKACAAGPQHLELALQMIAVLDKLSYDTADGLQVQCHGQYRPIHVFLSDDAVTVIDLDRSAPADPARDVAEFLQRMRTDVFDKAGSAAPADGATRAFLDAYVAATGSAAYLANLKFHYARHVVHRVNRLNKKGPAASEALAEQAFFLAELEDILTGRFDA